MPRAKKSTEKKVTKTTVHKVNSTVNVTLKSQNEIGISPFNVLAMVIVLVIFGFVGFVANRHNENKITQTKQSVAAVSAIAYDGEDGKNALDLLKSKTQIQTQDSSIGIFVISINGVTNSEDHFWMFYVNGELAQVGPDQYITKNADKIEWRYDQFN